VLVNEERLKGSLNILPKQAIIPRILVKLSSRSGRKASGIKMNAEMTFHVTTPYPPIRASRLSPKRTMRATLAPINSNVNNKLTITLARGPKETYAKSAKVMSELSTSKHLARSFAVYCVVTTENRKKVMPITHPE
jgi:hypothetical protein